MAQKPEPLEKLVKVFDTDVESEAMVVKGLLESAGIAADMANREAPQDILPGVGGVVILVREEQAAEAEAMIEEFRTHPATDADEAASEEPAEPKP
jgi:putative signal transducing protein